VSERISVRSETMMAWLAFAVPLPIPTGSLRSKITGTRGAEPDRAAWYTALNGAVATSRAVFTAPAVARFSDFSAPCATATPFHP
jgi:hypothetical protein